MKIHIVQPNETLTAIAAQHGVDMEAISKFNPNVTSDVTLEVGQKIKVPSSGVKVEKKPIGAPTEKEQVPTLPKWWYEEVQPTVDANLHESDKERFSSSANEEGSAPYPFVDPALVPALYPTSSPEIDMLNRYANTPAFTAPTTPPVQQIPYGYGAPAAAWYDPVMTILATNRIPIPPRVVNINGYRSVKVPSSLFQFDEWEEQLEE